MRAVDPAQDSFSPLDREDLVTSGIVISDRSSWSPPAKLLQIAKE